MYKDKNRQREANRLAQARRRQGMTGDDVIPLDVIPESISLPNIPGVKPLGMALVPTGSTCSSFDDLPKGVRVDIDSLAEWCKAKGIGFDRDAQVSRAIHYQRYVRAG